MEALGIVLIFCFFGALAVICWLVYWLCYGVGKVVGTVAAPVVMTGIAVTKGVHNVNRVINALGDAEELADLTVDAENYVAKKKEDGKKYWADFRAQRAARKGTGTVAVMATPVSNDDEGIG